MGILFVLFFWAVAGTILAGIGSAIAIGFTSALTKGANHNHKGVIIAAGLFPFCCLGWAGTVFAIQWIVNESVFHRDPGLGDSWKCPLPNGYAILFIDVTDYGTVYNPKTQLSPDSVSDKADAVSGVRLMQIAGRYILLEADSKIFEHFGQETNQIDSYTLLDTQAGTRTVFSTDMALRSAARQLGINPELKPIYEVYSKYRWTWFDGASIALLLGPPLISFVFLIWRVLQIRRQRSLVVSTSLP